MIHMLWISSVVGDDWEECVEEEEEGEEKKYSEDNFVTFFHKTNLYKYKKNAINWLLLFKMITLEIELFYDEKKKSNI